MDDLGDDQVMVWWPSRKRGKPWKGEHVNATCISKNGKSSVYVHTCSVVVSLHLHAMLCNKLLAIIEPKCTTSFVLCYRP